MIDNTVRLQRAVTIWIMVTAQFILLWVFTTPSHGQVDAERLTPCVVTAGRTQELTVDGKFPSWPAQIWCDRQDLSIEALDESGKIRVHVADDAYPGMAWLRVFDQQSASRLLPLLVNRHGTCLEQEPNDRVSTATNLELPTTAVGRLGKRGDVDCYQAEVKRGETLVATVHAKRLLNSPMDVVLQLCDLKGNVLQQSDDELGIDPQIVFTAKDSQALILRCFAFPETPNSTIGFAGGPDFQYAIDATVQPRLAYLLPLVLPPAGDDTGQSKPAPVSLTAFGYAGRRPVAGESPQLHLRIAPPTAISPRTAYLESDGDTAVSGWQWMPELPAPRPSLQTAEEGTSTEDKAAQPTAAFSIVSPPSTADGGAHTVSNFDHKGITLLGGYQVDLASSSADGTSASIVSSATGIASIMTTPSLVTGRIISGDQVDRIRFNAQKGAKYVAQIHSREFGFHLDSFLRVVNPEDQQTVAEGDDTGRHEYDARLEFTSPVEGPLQIEVSDRTASCGPRHAYTLEVQQVVPAVRLSIDQEHFQVVSGESLEIAINVQREHGFDRRLEIFAVDLPPGVTANRALSEPKGDSAKSVTLMLKADANAREVNGQFRILGVVSASPSTSATERQGEPATTLALPAGESELSRNQAVRLAVRYSLRPQVSVDQFWLTVARPSATASAKD